MTPPKVKICCISSLEEAELAISMGASAIGLVSEMPSGPGVILESTIREIANSVTPETDTFLLTSKQDSHSIIAQIKRCETNTVQIVDRLLHGTFEDIKNAIPEVKIVQVLHVQNNYDIEDAVKISKLVDAILLDSGNQSLKIKELGGTGRVHDWSISRQIVSSVDVPVYLAGGLNPDNVIDAIKTVKPFGLDLCSGVRKNGKLDKLKLEIFFNNVNSQIL